MSQILQNFVKFQKFQLENLVDFEKCCRTHIYLQKSEPIQPKTSHVLPKFCQPTLSARRPGRAYAKTRRPNFEMPVLGGSCAGSPYQDACQSACYEIDKLSAVVFKTIF